MMCGTTQHLPPEDGSQTRYLAHISDLALKETMTLHSRSSTSSLELSESLTTCLSSSSSSCSLKSLTRYWNWLFLSFTAVIKYDEVTRSFIYFLLFCTRLLLLKNVSGNEWPCMCWCAFKKLLNHSRTFPRTKPTVHFAHMEQHTIALPILNVHKNILSA